MLYGGCFTRIKHDERERMTMPSSFVSFAEKKKRERKKTIRIKLKKKWNEIKKIKNRGRRKRSFLLFIFSVWKRKSRTWQSYEKDFHLVGVFVSCVYTFVLLVARDICVIGKKKTKIRTIFLACIFHLFSFFRFRTVAHTARYYPRRVMSRVARVRVRIPVWCCVRTRGCKYNN